MARVAVSRPERLTGADVAAVEHFSATAAAIATTALKAWPGSCEPRVSDATERDDATPGSNQMNHVQGWHKRMRCNRIIGPYPCKIG